MEMKKEKLDELRKTMGTLPESNPPFETKFYKGVTDINVELIDWPHNPYKAMFVLATSCWGRKINKWKETSVEGRIMVVNAVLRRIALPLAYEAPSFTFTVENIPRWSYDQICRARVGIVFSSQGTRDNNHQDCGFFIHDDIYNDPELRKDFEEAALKCKDVYKKIVDKGKGNWQSARSILPISNAHAFSFACNFAALQNMVSNRAKFCEGDATVAFAWLVREELKKKFPLLALHLYPGCDGSGVCTYTKSYYLSNCFGCLFKSCGRNKVQGDYKNYATINQSCSDRDTIMKQLGIYIPTAEEVRQSLDVDKGQKVAASDMLRFIED